MKLITLLFVLVAALAPLRGQTVSTRSVITDRNGNLLSDFTVASGRTVTVGSGGSLTVVAGATVTFADNSLGISTVTGLQSALNAKAPLESPTFTGTVSGITKSMVGLGSVDNTSDVAKPISTATQTALDSKLATSAFTGAATRDLLAGLSGENRLDAAAIKNLPAGEVTLAGAQTLSNKTLAGFTQTGAVTAPPTTITTAIDVAKPLNEVAISNSSTTLTFSATPATGTRTVLRVTNSDDEAQAITIPEVFSEARNATRTTLNIPAAGSLSVLLERQASRWVILGDPVSIADLPASGGPVDPVNSVVEVLNTSTGFSERRTVAQLSQPMSPGTVRANTLDVASVPQDVPITALPPEMFPDGGSVGNVIGLTNLSPRTFGLIPNASGYQAPVALGAGTEIDLSAGTLFTKTLSANTTFTFANVGSVSGKPFEVLVTNPSTYTVDWPGTVRWENDAEPTQTTGGKADLYRFLVVGSDVVGGRALVAIPADTTAPTVTGASIDSAGSLLTATFSEAMSVGGDGSGGFTLAGLSAGSATLSGFGLAGDNLSATWTISRAIYNYETPTLGYTQPGAGLRDLSGNNLATFSGGSITNNSTVSGYLLSEDFGAQNGWSDGNVFFDYAATGLDGAFALKITNPNSSFVRETWKAFTAQDVAHGYLIFRTPVSAPGTDSNIFALADSSGNLLFRMTFRSTRVIRMTDEGGTSHTGTTAWPLDTNIHIWWEYQKGTGANGVMRFWAATSATKPGSQQAGTTSATKTAQAGRVYLRSQYAVDGYHDKIRVSTTDVGSNPL